MENDLAIAVILYHPTDAEVAALRTLSNWGGRLVLFNNGTTHAFADFSPRTEVLGDGTNAGVSRGLNAILDQAFVKGREKFVLFLDQDSIIDADAFKKAWIDISKRLDQKTIFGLQESENTTTQVLPTWLLINSGTIFTKSAWDDIGGMDERYFVDGIDYDYSFRLHCAGYSMYAYRSKGLFDHTTNQVGRSVRFLGKRIWIRNYGIRYNEIYRSLALLIWNSLKKLELNYAKIFARALIISLTGHLLSVVANSPNTERSKAGK